MMDQAVLVIVEVRSIKDHEALNKYRAEARIQAASRNCAIVGRGGSLLEGSPELGEMVVQRWSSRKEFIEWQNSDEYRPLKELRRACADFRISMITCAP